MMQSPYVSSAWLMHATPAKNIGPPMMAAPERNRAAPARQTAEPKNQSSIVKSSFHRLPACVASFVSIRVRVNSWSVAQEARA